MIMTSIPVMSIVTLADELSGDQIANEPRYELNFNKQWKFNYGDVANAQSTAYSDKSWDDVSLPHDFSIIQDFTTRGTEGESGSLPGGTGWYRKSFILPQSVHDRVFILNFGASYQETTVYVNGTKVGENFNGYNSFSFDISDYLHFDGATQNVIAVKVVNNIPSSRWYSGSGLIGDVTLSVLRNIHVGLYGTQILTPDLASSNGTDGTTNIKVEIHNDAATNENINVVADIMNASGSVVATTSQSLSISGNTTKNITLTAEVPAPALWSVDTPNMYTARVRIEENGEALDEYYTDFGYTWSAWSQSTGFSLNGQKLKLQGVCMHHDQGGLGAVQEYDAIYRQLSILKSMGVNAVRTSHNTASKVFIQVCNELGLLVMEEFLDGWYAEKNGNTYDFSDYFNTYISSNNHIIGGSGLKWFEFVAKQAVLRDRNDPCIFMWDLGNELSASEFNDTSTYNSFKNIISALDSRPITIGSNYNGSNDNYPNPLSGNGQLVDVFGGNYNLSLWLSKYGQFGRPFVGTETASAVGSRGVYRYTSSNYSQPGTYYEHNINYASSSDFQISAYDAAKVGWGNTAADAWYNTIVNDWFSGEFVWTGFDYIGEPTPWNAYMRANYDYAYPNSSYFGIVDTAGFAKDSYYLYDSFWDNSETTLHLVPGTWNRSNLAVDSNGYVDTAIYTNAPYVELLYNGTVIAKATATTYRTNAGFTYTTYTETVVDSSKCKTGTLQDSNDHNFYPLFEVKYDASATLTLKAYQSEGGAEITDTVGTKKVYANSATNITVGAWNGDTTLTADGDSFNYIEVTAVDANGNFANDYNGTLNVTLTSSSGAGVIAAVDNGNAATTQKFQSSTALLSDTTAQIQMFNGKALIIVKSTEKAGKINVTVAPTDLPYESIGLTSEVETGDELTDEFEEIFDQTVDVSNLDNQTRYEFLDNMFDALEAPVEEISYELYTLGSGAVTQVPSGYYMISGTDTTGNTSTGVLGTLSSSSGTLNTSGSEPILTSQTFSFQLQDNGKYIISYVDENITTSFLNVSADGVFVSKASQELDVVLTDGKVKIGDGTNYITYSASSSNTAGVSTSGTALKLYQVKDGEVRRFGDVGIVEDGQYIIYGTSNWSNASGYVMTPTPKTVSTFNGLEQSAATPSGGEIETSSANEWIIEKVEDSEDTYTIRNKDGKYLYIDSSGNAKLYLSDTEKTVRIRKFRTENRVVIDVNNYVLDLYGDGLFSQYIQSNWDKLGENERFELYRKVDATSSADIALYNALENALAANPAAYESESYANLLDAVQAGLEKYGKDTVSDSDKTAAADAITAAFNALEKSSISPTLKNDIANLDEPVSVSGGYFKYTASSGSIIPDGEYIIYVPCNVDGAVGQARVMTGTAATSGSNKGFGRATATVSGDKITTAEANEWTITYNSSTGKYTIVNKDGGYLNISTSSNRNVTASSTAVEMSITGLSNGKVNIHNSNYYLQNQDTSGSEMFSSWTGSGSGNHEQIELYRKQYAYDATNKKALYDALQKGAATNQELYTTATYTALLQVMQNGYDVFINDTSSDADIIAATQAINRAYDALKYLNLRPLLESQIAALVPPPGSQARYGRYTAKQTSATIIPDGDYVISCSEGEAFGNNAAWGVMTTTSVKDSRPHFTAYGWAATYSAPTIDSETWQIERDTSTGYYRISRVYNGTREYLYVPNDGVDDNCELPSTSASKNSSKWWWSAEIDAATGKVKFRSTANTTHLITFIADYAYSDSNLSSGVRAHVSAYYEGGGKGGTPLTLHRKENGQLVEWYAPVADGKYIITQRNNDYEQKTNNVTDVMDITTVPENGAFAEKSDVSISDNKITTSVAYELNFSLVGGTNNYYYISNNSGQYLTMTTADTSLSFTPNPTPLVVEANEHGVVYISHPSKSDQYIDHYERGVFGCWGGNKNQNNCLRLFRYEQMLSQTDKKLELFNKLHEAIAIDQGNYSDESYNNLLLAIKDGIDSYNNDTTDAEWQAAIDAIDRAIAKLEIAKASFPATIYKYGYTSASNYAGGGKDFNEITYMEMADVINSTPAILDQIKTLIGYDTATWASDSERETALQNIVKEYAKIYSLAFTGFPVKGGTEIGKRTDFYDTYWNIWEKPGTKAQGENNNEGASVQGLFSTTLDENGLPGTHDPYDNALGYINTTSSSDTQNNDNDVAGLHQNLFYTIIRNRSNISVTLSPLEDISVYVPDFFSREAIRSSDELGSYSSTYAKQYWDVQFPFLEYTNMFGVNTYVYDSSDTERVFQASYDDTTHTAKAQLTEIDDPTKGLVHIPHDMPDNKGFFPFNYRLDGSNANMTTTEDGIYHYGMSFTTEFYIPSSGNYGDGNDIVFEFSGDDDVLVYIDNVLVLDNGGLHGARYANINFTKKAVSYQYLADVETGTVTNAYSEGITYTYGAENAGISTRNQAALEYLHKIATDGEQHTFKFYYLERGSTESNCKLMFNIQKISDYVKLNDQSYVVDFGLPVQFDIKDNNELSAPEGYELANYEYIGVTDTVPARANSLVMFTEPTETEITRFGSETKIDFEGHFGTYFINKDGNIKYEPHTMQFSDAGSIYMCAKVDHDPTYKDGTVYYAFEKITIIPATTIYYEDDFQGDAITYTDGTVPTGQSNPDNHGVWQNVTSALPTGVIKGEIYQHTDRPGATNANAYGYDEAYDECAVYSGFSSHYVTVSAKNNPNATYSGGAGASWPEAEFTFAGTGFDLISVTSKDTGAMNLTVRNADGNIVKNHTVNTYYGYTYGQIFRAADGSETLTDTGKPLYLTDNRGYTETPTYYAANGTIVTENTTGDLEPAYAFGWITENIPEDKNALYQIPVIKVTDLDYGTYTVKITPMYSSRMDTAKDGAYDFYVDAVRIYNPAGIGDTLTNPTISYAYTQDREANPDYLELRNMLISTNKLTNDGTSAEGVVFIDGIADNDDVSKYTAGGPNNELYLLKGQAVAFQIWASSVPDDIQISAKAVGEEDPTMFVSYTTTTALYTAEALITTATDLSYSVDALLRKQSEGQLGWTPVTGSDGNTYYSSGTIVIQNITDGIISITNIKWTFPSSGFGYFENLENNAQTTAEEPVMLMSDYSTFRMARSAVRAVNADLEINEDDVVVENNNVTAGESIKINVSTSTDVDTLVIRDENGNVITPEAIESYVETIDNKDVKLWTVTLSENEAGTYIYTVTGAYENGFESENPVIITVTVEEIPQPEEKPEEEPEKEPTFLEKLIGFFNRLADFFNKLINLIIGNIVL